MNCKLVGSFVQHLEVELQPREVFYAQKGALIYLDTGITKELAFTGGSGLTRLIGARISGESLLGLRFINQSNQPRRLVIGSDFGLFPIKLNNESIICHKGVYVASSDDVQISVKVSVAGVMGGMGFFLQKISGCATVFLDTIGTPIVRELGYGESIEIDEDHIVALKGISESQMSSSWSLKNMIGGEGLSLLKVTGPGTVYLSPGKFVSDVKS